jgi:hypothetical protein
MKQFFDGASMNYRQLQTIENFRWVCGFCSHKVSSDRGYKIGLHGDASGAQVGGIYVCPSCLGPTFRDPDGVLHPAPAVGAAVTHLPVEVETTYEEARRCSSQNCFTAAVLLCRKILMNTAVAQGANTNLKFIEYVEYLANNGFIPPNGKPWVDRIRAKGNEATHEIAPMKLEDAKEILGFTEMLLKFVYEFPAIAGTP